MVKIEVEFDDAEILALIKEEWYKKARYQTAKILRDKAEQMIYSYLQNNIDEFERMFKEALQFVLSQYTIRDMKAIEKLWNTTQKAKIKR